MAADGLGPGKNLTSLGKMLCPPNGEADSDFMTLHPGLIGAGTSEREWGGEEGAVRGQCWKRLGEGVAVGVVGWEVGRWGCSNRGVATSYIYTVPSPVICSKHQRERKAFWTGKTPWRSDIALALFYFYPCLLSVQLQRPATC